MLGLIIGTRAASRHAHTNSRHARPRVVAIRILVPLGLAHPTCSILNLDRSPRTTPRQRP